MSCAGLSPCLGSGLENLAATPKPGRQIFFTNAIHSTFACRERESMSMSIRISQSDEYDRLSVWLLLLWLKWLWLWLL